MPVPEQPTSLFIVICYDSLLIPIPAGGWDTLFIKPSGNCPISVPRSPPFIDLTHNRSGYRVDQQVVLVGRVFLIAIGRIAARSEERRVGKECRL